VSVAEREIIHHGSGLTMIIEGGADAGVRQAFVFRIR
jgi:hypothetical protein